jgi:hypothetical protein
MIRYRHVAGAALLAALSSLGSSLGAQDNFTFAFSGADSLPAVEGKAQGSYLCTLAHQGTGEGARAWSISVTAEGGTIESIDLDGTQAAGLLQPANSFAHHETTSGEDNEGAVSAVVLDFFGDSVLPPNTTSSIAHIVLAIDTTPQGTQRATLKYQNGLRGSGEPVRNVVTQAGSAASMAFQTKLVTASGDGDPALVDACPVRMLDNVTGQIDDGSDAYTFPVFAGTLLDVKVKLGAESPTFGLRLLDPNEMPVDLTAFLTIKKKNAQLKKIPLALPGVYSLVLEDATAPVNPYQLQLKGKAPKTALALKGELLPAAVGEVLEVELYGLEGAILSGTFKTKKGTTPDVLALLAPSGASVPIEGFLVEKPTSAKLNKVPLPESGPYVLQLTVTGVVGPVKGALKQKLAKGRKLIECDA